MDAAWTDDDEETVVRVGALDNGDGFVAAAEDGGLGGRCLWDFVL